MNLETLLEIKIKLYREKEYLLSQTRIVNNKIEKNKNDILNTCNHNWVRDNCSYGPYEKPDDICTICNSINYRW